jgi:hypothetical protein
LRFVITEECSLILDSAAVERFAEEHILPLTAKLPLRLRLMSLCTIVLP